VKDLDKEQNAGKPLTHDGVRLTSIRHINALPDATKHALYRSLIPQRILEEHCVRSGSQAQLSFQIRCPADASSVEIDVRHPIDMRDPVMYVHMADTPGRQLEVLLMVVNDLTKPRFDVGRDQQGQPTKFGTTSRNILAEIAALQAGLAPGQTRQGLRLSRELIPIMERFTTGLGKDRFFIEPLAYHNAIMFERYGFTYMVGQGQMEQIHQDFQPGERLYQRLDGSTPFRQPGFDRTVRGRSWAIHDGILGRPWSQVRMYKRVSVHASICTFPGAIY
jgi:hypothetical protein